MAHREPEAAVYLQGVAIARSNANGLNTKGLTNSLETLVSKLCPQLYCAEIGEFVAHFGNRIRQACRGPCSTSCRIHSSSHVRDIKPLQETARSAIMVNSRAKEKN